MRRPQVLLTLVFATACSGQGASFSAPAQPDAFVVQAAKTDALRYLGAGATVIAVCGPSVGSSLFLDKAEEGFLEDGIKDGVIVLAKRADGRPEVLTRDVMREMIVASEDGGQISTLKGRENNGGLGVWVIQYPSTGVIISHNVAKHPAGGLVDLWTQNKPEVGLLPARTSTFLSRCEARS